MAAATEPLRTCPYTGEPFTVDHVLGRGWIPVGLFDPARQFLTAELAWKALSRRNGKDPEGGGIKDRCPYTQKKFTVSKLPNGRFQAVGLFTPVRLYATTRELDFAVSTRHGVKPKFPPRPRITLGEDPLDKPSDQLAGLVDGSLDPYMEKLEQLDRERSG